MLALANKQSLYMSRTILLPVIMVAAVWEANHLFGDEMKERFLSEASMAWAEFRDMQPSNYAVSLLPVPPTRSVGAIMSGRIMEPDVDTDTEAIIRWKTHEGRMMIEVSRTDRSRINRVRASNSQYVFSVVPVESGEWIVEWVERKDSARQVDFDSAWREFAPGEFATPLLVGSESLDTMIEQPHFELLKATITDDGIWKIEFAYENDTASDPLTSHRFNPVQEGVLWLDSNMYCLIVRAELRTIISPSETDKQNVVIKTIDYPNRQEDRIPCEYHVVQHVIQFNEFEYEAHQKYRFDPEALKPYREFYLTHFGLPEPDWYRGQTPYWLYTSIAGMILFIIGVLLLKFGVKLWQRS